MIKQSVYHEYVNEKLVPYWYVLTFDQISWDTPVIYIVVQPPFEYFERDMFDDTMPAVSVTMNELILNHNYPRKLGIYLKRVKQRIVDYGGDPTHFRQFIFQIPDVDEVLRLIPNSGK
ncbi:hypothetical protein ABES25_18285 [Bacillus gobiensis]|uniref:hypothetical protein n=1 Tax=Bacillus gobiensis TaxID=1441095 RepID=UPI003D1991BA